MIRHLIGVRLDLKRTRLQNRSPADSGSFYIYRKGRGIDSKNVSNIELFRVVKCRNLSKVVGV